VNIAHRSIYPTLRKLEGVITKLEPLSEQHTIVRFLHNTDNAKTLTGFVQELTDAITDYQVGATDLIVIFTECPPRCRYSKQCTIERGRSMTAPRSS
jgi:hypothetical protein